MWDAIFDRIGLDFHLKKGIQILHSMFDSI